jgi:hypothetical protein
LTSAGQCPAGSGTIRITAVREGDSPYISDYLCSASGGPFTRLPVGTYTTWLTITDTNGVTRFAESAEATVTVGDGTVTPVSFSLYTDRAFFAASWNLTRQGAPTTCNAVSADKMSVLATVSRRLHRLRRRHQPVHRRRGRRGGVHRSCRSRPAWTYTVVVAALNPLGESLGDSAPLLSRRPTVGNAALDLETITVPIR